MFVFLLPTTQICHYIFLLAINEVTFPQIVSVLPTEVIGDFPVTSLSAPRAFS